MVPDNGNSCTAVITSTNTSATQATSIEMATSSASEGGQLSLTSTMATNTPSPSSSSVTIAASGGEGSHHHHHRNSHRHQSRSPSSAAAASRGVSSSSSASSSSTTSSSSAHDYLYFDSNTFKQVKRLYCGMLLVAVAYSLTMIVMMVFLYKTLPHPGMAGGSATFGGGSLVPSPSNSPSSHAGFNLKLYSHSAMAGVPSPTDADHALQMFGSESKSVSFQRGNSLSDGPLPAALPAAPEAAASTASASSPSAVSGTSTTTGGGFFRSHDGRLAISHETARTYLDQVIAINFLTLILYSLAFYAAHRELYTLTLAFTSTLSFTMMFSVVKIFVEGVHFPNNFMSLLLRVSIVFVALVYLGQLRRKQHFVRSLWLSPSSLLHHPALRGSQMTPNQTAQLIRDFLAASSAAAVASGSSGGLTLGLSHLATFGKADEDQLPEYQDMPPNYEEALRCPVPSEGATPTSASPTTTTSSSFAASTSVQMGTGTAETAVNSSSSSSSTSRAASQLTLGGGPPPPAFDELLRASQTSLDSGSSDFQQPPPVTIITVPDEVPIVQTTKEA